MRETGKVQTEPNEEDHFEAGHTKSGSLNDAFRVGLTAPAEVNPEVRQ
jgi:hypothetical protein